MGDDRDMLLAMDPNRRPSAENQRSAGKRRPARENDHPRHEDPLQAGNRFPAPMAKEAAALLASGPSAPISHRSAAYLWRLLDGPPSKVEVTLVGRRCRPKQGVTIRTVARFERRDRRQKRCIWLTSPARTIVDLAAEADDHELERLIAATRRQLIEEPYRVIAHIARALERHAPAAGFQTNVAVAAGERV